MNETFKTSLQTIGSYTELHSVAKKLVAEEVAEVTGDRTRVQNDLDFYSSKMNRLGFLVGKTLWLLAIALITVVAKGCS